jgi:hypothetical protein
MVISILETTTFNACFFGHYPDLLELMANILCVIIAFANYHCCMIICGFCDKMKINLVVRKIMFYFAAVSLLVRGDVNTGFLFLRCKSSPVLIVE